MGIDVGWIAVRGAETSAVLAELAMTETGKRGGPWALRYSVAQRDGWVIAAARDTQFVLPQRVKQLSHIGLAVGGFMSEHVMQSGACLYEAGAQKWWVLHEPDEGIDNLTFGGDLPAEFEQLRTEALRNSAQAQRSGEGVDYVFDVPIALTASVCGYRPDEDEEDAGFTELRAFSRGSGKPTGIFGMIGELFRR